MSRDQIHVSADKRLARRFASSGAKSLIDETFAQYLDEADQLSRFRNEFSLPTKEALWPELYAKYHGDVTLEDQQPAVYLAGNSLGLMPKTTPALLQQELEVWSKYGVLGHMQHTYQRPWVKIDETVTEALSKIVGANRTEVACMGSLTSNLHTLFTSFYKPTPKRHKIMFEGKAFPSDQYAFASQAALHDYPASSLLRVDPLAGEYTIRTEEILKIIEEEGDSIAVICFGAVQYYSGEFFDMEAITKAGHAKGCLVAFDLAHAVGNVPLSLHDWGVDFACWCSYKYLNSGPGGIAGIYVHERWADKHRLQGWWGHNVETRFAMSSTFDPIPGAGGWQFSNPSVLDVVALMSSLEVFKRAGRIAPPKLSGGQQTPSDLPILGALREKSVEMTLFLETLLKASRYYLSIDKLSKGPSDGVSFTIITPADPERRGAQLSLLFHPVEAMDPIFERLREGGVLGDERRPGVIRFAPVPMYNSFSDCWKAAQVLEKALKDYPAWLRERDEELAVQAEAKRRRAEKKAVGSEAEDGVRRS